MKADSTDAMRQKALENVRARMDMMLDLYALLADLENAIERDDPETASAVLLSLAMLKQKECS